MNKRILSEIALYVGAGLFGFFLGGIVMHERLDARAADAEAALEQAYAEADSWQLKYEACARGSLSKSERADILDIGEATGTGVVR